jgi:hypothetical protein
MKNSSTPNEMTTLKVAILRLVAAPDLPVTRLLR